MQYFLEINDDEEVCDGFRAFSKGQGQIFSVLNPDKLSSVYWS